MEAFIKIVQEEILVSHTARKAPQVFICAADSRLQQLLEVRLKRAGFRTVVHGSTASLADLYGRSEPDLIAVVASGRRRDVELAVSELIDKGVDFHRTATVLVTDESRVTDLQELRATGIIEVLPNTDRFDRAVAALGELWAAMARERAVLPSGAWGSLSDMNLIDLLQALGPSGRTVKITVQPGKRGSDTLVLYLCQGSITFSQYADLTGAAAVYEGLAWQRGAWTVQPITEDEIPQSNNVLPNEAILMEGCRLLDERARGKQLV
jgi:hypothetical protein